MLKRFVKYLIGQNYFLSRWWWKRGLEQSLKASSGDPIIDYQMGKVGSSTIRVSLTERGLNQAFYHVHFLNPVRVAEIERQRRQYFGTDKQALLTRPWTYQFLYEQIQKKDRHWKIITLVREPVARNISTFFENLEVSKKPDGDLYAIKSDYYGIDIEVSPDNVEPLISLFFERLQHDRPLRYFDDEIKTVFGLDVYTDKFPTQKGYRIYPADHADLLLIRLENLNDCAADAFRAFMDIDDFSLVQTNVGSEKIYAPLYSAFKQSIRLPESYLDRMYNAKYTRYFFTDEEIRGFRRNWKTEQMATTQSKNVE